MGPTRIHDPVADNLKRAEENGTPVFLSNATTSEPEHEDVSIKHHQALTARIRRFTVADAAPTHAVFYAAVRIGAAGHYSPAELQDWAPTTEMPGDWGQWLAENITFVAAPGDRVTGFMMLEPSGYLNMAFVLPEFRGTGLADALYAAVLTEARACAMPRLSVLASRMAARFFARHGWQPAPELAASLGAIPQNTPMKLDPVPA